MGDNQHAKPMATVLLSYHVGGLAHDENKLVLGEKNLIRMSLSHFQTPKVVFDHVLRHAFFQCSLRDEFIFLDHRCTLSSGILPIYSLYFSPLAKYPGPFFAKISSWPNFYHTFGGDRHIWLWQCHQIYGPVFRYRPDGIMTNSPSAHHAIYSAKANVKKGEYYYVWPKNHARLSTWSVTDRKQHVRKRKVLSNAFSDRAVRSAEQFVIRHVDRWCELLIQDAGNNWSKPRNIARWSEFLVFDILTDLCFGKSFGLKEPGENKLKDVPNQIATTLALHHPIGNAPFTPLWVWLKPRGLDRLFNLITPANIKKFYSFVETSVIERSKLELANPFDDSSNENPKEAPSEKPTTGRDDMFHYLFQAKDPDTGKIAYTPDELFGEAELLIVAGSDTTTTAISAAFFYLTHNPQAQATLKHELLTAFTSVDEIRSGPKLSSCKYLRACLDESMRMSPPVAADLNREVLPGGMQLEGEMIPAGTNVATDTYALHHNEQVFPDPFDFRPERWIEDENNKTTAADVARVESAFAPFSIGPRGCVGKNLAYLELMVTLARVLYRMDMVRVNDDEEGGKVGGGDPNGMWGRRREGQFQLRDYFVAGKDGPWVRVKARGDKVGT